MAHGIPSELRKSLISRDTLSLFRAEDKKCSRVGFMKTFLEFDFLLHRIHDLGEFYSILMNPGETAPNLPCRFVDIISSPFSCVVEEGTETLSPEILPLIDADFSLKNFLQSQKWDWLHAGQHIDKSAAPAIFYIRGMFIDSSKVLVTDPLA